MCWESEAMKESKWDFASLNLLFLKKRGSRVSREERDGFGCEIEVTAIVIGGCFW